MTQTTQKLAHASLLLKYFQQPVFSKKTKLILSYPRFAHLQRVQHIETCFRQSSSFARLFPLLEKCWAKS